MTLCHAQLIQCRRWCGDWRLHCLCQSRAFCYKLHGRPLRINELKRQFHGRDDHDYSKKDKKDYWCFQCSNLFWRNTIAAQSTSSPFFASAQHRTTKLNDISSNGKITMESNRVFIRTCLLLFIFPCLHAGQTPFVAKATTRCRNKTSKRRRRMAFHEGFFQCD